MRIWIGRSILLIAVIHTVFGIVFLGDAVALVLRGGVFNTVTLVPPTATGTAFWFFVTGFLAFVLGGLMHHLEYRDIAFPAFLPWSLLALTIAGCVLMPVSAWWLFLLPVIGMFVRIRRMASSASAR